LGRSVLAEGKKKKEKSCVLDDVWEDVVVHHFHPGKYEAIRRIYEDLLSTINRIALENDSHHSCNALPYQFSKDARALISLHRLISYWSSIPQVYLLATILNRQA